MPSFNNTVAHNMPTTSRALKRYGSTGSSSSAKRSRRSARTSVRLPRSLNPPGGSFKQARVLRFKRSRADTFILNSNSAPSGWTAVTNGLTQTLVTSLSSVPGYTDFVNLFDSYRITGVRLQGYYSGTNAPVSSNQNAMLYVTPNHMGNVDVTNLEEQWFMDRPRTKKIPLMNDEGKMSFDEYLPLSQLSETYQSATGTDYALAKPHFISTGENGCPHYGACLRLQRMDNEDFTHGASVDYPSLKIITTWYLEVRGMA